MKSELKKIELLMYLFTIPLDELEKIVEWIGNTKNKEPNPLQDGQR